MKETLSMGAAAPKVGLSRDEYLAFDRRLEIGHEYINGEIFAMSGRSFEHSAIAAAILGMLRNELTGRNCTPLTSDMRVGIPRTGRYVYPDASIVRGEPQLEDDERDTLLNPVVVVEVLSDSSEAYDRGDKFASYQTVPSLKQYVLASQKSARIEVFTRQDGGGWLLRSYEAGQRVALDAIDCQLAVDDIYQGVVYGARIAADGGKSGP